MNKIRRIRGVICLLLCLFMITANQVWAAEAAYGIELHVTHDGKAIPGAEFEIYRVGEVYNSGRFGLSGSFVKYPVNVNVSTTQEMQNAADTLYAYAKVDLLKPRFVGGVSESGVLVINDLNKGLYLIAGKTLISSTKTYQFQPMLISLPYDGKDHVVMNVKYSVVENDAEPISLKVLKSWKDQGYSGKRPHDITVYLLKDGNIHDVVELNKNNNWRYEWTMLDAASQWSVSEEVLSKYTTVIRKEGEKTFLIVNTYIKPDDDDDDPPTKETTPVTTPETTPGKKDVYVVTERSKPTGPDTLEIGEGDLPFGVIPRTGMNWWPSVVFAALGFCLIVLGVIMRRRDIDE